MGEGGGCYGFWGKKVMSAILIEKEFLSMTWANKIFLKHSMPDKNIVFVEKNNVKLSRKHNRLFML